MEFGDEGARGLANVFHLKASHEMMRRKKGAISMVRGEVLVSPFGSDDEYGSLRSGAEARHVVLRAEGIHRRAIGENWESLVRVRGQWASGPVLQADEMALGGAGSLRGLPEQFALGDVGLLGGVELRSAGFDLWEVARVRPLVFIQAGVTRDEVLKRSEAAQTAGVGFYFQGLGEMVNAQGSFHAGWRLDDPGSEIHARLEWTF